jgi:hypothetical protein
MCDQMLDRARVPAGLNQLTQRGVSEVLTATYSPRSSHTQRSMMKQLAREKLSPKTSLARDAPGAARWAEDGISEGGAGCTL